MSLSITVAGIAYLADPNAVTITPETVVSLLAADLLETGEPIGPQTDELAGVVGSWDQYPESVVAAMLDVADRLSLRVGAVSEVAAENHAPDEAAVTAAIGDGGFDALGNWHDPGSGEFAKPGWSTAKAVALSALRALLDAADGPDGAAAVLTRPVPALDLNPGDTVRVRRHDHTTAEILGHGRLVRVPWDYLRGDAAPDVDLPRVPRPGERWVRNGAFRRGPDGNIPAVYRVTAVRGGFVDLTPDWNESGQKLILPLSDAGPLPGAKPFLSTFEYAAYATLRTPTEREAPVSGMTWSRAPDDGRFNRSTIYSSGPWRITKSFYADGPSMFEWVLTNTDSGDVYESHPTLAKAKADAAARAANTAPAANDRPETAGVARWYDADIDGETIAPFIRTGDEPRWVIAVRDEPEWPLRAAGYSTAETETEALADAEAMAPSAAEYKVGPARLRTERPPDTIRAFKRPDLDIDAAGEYRFHEEITLNGYTIGVLAREDRGIGDESGPLIAFVPATGERLGPFEDRDAGIATLTERAAATPRVRLVEDTSGVIRRTAVPVGLLDQIRGRVEKLNRRAERKGLTGRVALDVGDTYVAARTDEAGNTWKFEAVDLNITATPVALAGGWEFAGTVDFKSMRDANPDGDPNDPAMVLLHSTGGYQLPESFRAAAVCDDCGRAMPRNKLIVAADSDGNLTRLGTTCVRDVLGHDPASLLWFSEAVREFDDDDMYSGPPPPKVWPVDDYLAEAIVAIDAFGWRKAAHTLPTRQIIDAAAEREKSSDPDEVKELRALLRDPERMAAAKAKAAQVVAWVQSDAFPMRSEFDQNLASALGSQLVTRRTAGVAAYAPVAYDRAQERAQAYEARLSEVPNEWVGKPGEKVELTGMVRSIRTIDGFRGPTDIVTIDTDQGTVKTFTTGAISDYAQRALDAKTPLRFAATVKGHDEYPKGSGRRETNVTNAKVLLTRADQLRDEAAKAEAARENLTYQALHSVSQAKFLHGDSSSLGIDDDARAAWTESVLARLDKLTPEQLTEFTAGANALADEDDSTFYPSQYRNMTSPGTGASGEAIGSDYHARPGAVVGYPIAPSYGDAPLGPWYDNPGPFTVDIDSNLVGSDGTVVYTADEIQGWTKAHRDWERLDYKERQDTPEPPKPPTFRVLTQRGVTTPWQDHGPLTVTVKSGTTYTIATDGSVSPTPVGDDNPWSAALDADRQARTLAYRRKLNEYVDTALANPAAPEPDIFTPENLDALTLVPEFKKGRKTYRVEPGGDVIDNATGKRLTAKSSDPILRAVLAEQGFEPPEPPPAPAPDLSPVAPVANDRPATPEAVGSALIEALPQTPPFAAYRERIAAPWMGSLAAAWRSGGVADSRPARVVQWVAGDVFDADRSMLSPSTADEVIDFDVERVLTDLHEATQEMLAENNVPPSATVTLYRGFTASQASEWDGDGRPDRIRSTPLVSLTSDFRSAARTGQGGVATIEVPARNIVTVNGFTPGEVVVFSPPDGLAVSRVRSTSEDAAAVAAGRDVGLTPTDDTPNVSNRSMAKLLAHIDSLGPAKPKVKGFKPTPRQRTRMKYLSGWDEPGRFGMFTVEELTDALDAAEMAGKPTVRTPAVREALHRVATLLPDDVEVKASVPIGLKAEKIHGIADALARYSPDTIAKLRLRIVDVSSKSDGKAMGSMRSGRGGASLYFTARGHTMTPTAADNQGNWGTVNLASTPRQIAELIVLHEIGHLVHATAVGGSQVEMSRDSIDRYVPDSLRPDFAADRVAKRNMTRYGATDTVEWVAEAHVLAVTGNAVPHVRALTEGIWRRAGLNPADLPDVSGSYYSPEYISDLEAGEAIIAERTKAERRLADIAKMTRFKPGDEFRLGYTRYRRTENGFVRVSDGHEFTDAAAAFDAAKGLQ